MGFPEQLKLIHRAWKYRLTDDRSGIGFLLKHIRKGDIVFDIGAHKGGYTYWMRKAAGKKGKVVAFEPQQKGAELLKALFTDVVIENLGVSDASGFTDLHIAPQSYSVSFEASLTKEYTGAVTEKVKTTTIDAYCLQHALRPAFLKIDVEGHEMNVLRGAERILRIDKPFLLIETEERHIGEVREIFAWLTKTGYKGKFFFRGKELPLEQFRTDIHQSREAKADSYCNNFMFEPV